MLGSSSAGNAELTDAAPPEAPEPNWHPGPWPVAQTLAGTVTISPEVPAQAGSWQSYEIIYTAGKFGIDDSGSLKLCFRFASDMTKPQLSDPGAPGYTTVEASNGAVLDARFDMKLNVRPWDRTLLVKVVNGYLREGDTLTIRLGDNRRGSPGVRMQTFAEPFFGFRMLVDPIACYLYTPLAQQPIVPIVAGVRHDWIAVLPSVCAIGEAVQLRIRSEDLWGNASGIGAAELRLSCGAGIEGLPDTVAIPEGQAVIGIGPLTARAVGDVIITVTSSDSTVVASTNPMRVMAETHCLRPFWADLHAQSGETIGTNSAIDYFRFARDIAWVDVVGHQGNDFQITPAFWARLDQLYEAFDAPGRFVTIPGYEWSGNTALGGDRNVFYRSTGRPIRRSSHALVSDHSDLASDCHTAAELFASLRRDGEDAITFAHVGGRYADIGVAHDPAIETAVEVHSSWGTFEWLVEDAFRLGYRVGIVANSDGHKGRPGAEGPGASLFGAYGGLTALVMPGLSRAEVFEALRARRHYGTTGARMLLDVRARFDDGATLFDKDPVLGSCGTSECREALMGAIVHTEMREARLQVDVAGCAPVERIAIRNGLETVMVHRPYAAQELGRRIRIVWSGAEYRGRFRMTPWDGRATLSGNAFDGAHPINFFNKDRELRHHGDSELSWESITTGNFSGFDALLADPLAGTLRLETRQGAVEIAVAEIGLEPVTFDFGGLRRKIELYRLPDANPHRRVQLDVPVALSAGKDNALYVCVTTEDGHQAWSSPIYAISRPVWL